MADLAVGLSKTVVAGALTKVQLVIDEDSKLRQKAQRDLVTITLEFEMMNSFLSVVNKERTTNNLVVTWVRHVRELAYDLEDCVEFVVHLDSKRIFWRRLLPSCVVGALPLDQAVTEIEELKSRAKELSECYSRYSHIVDPASMQQAASPATGETSSSMLAEAKHARRWQGLGDLVHLIINKRCNDPHLQVISVWGTGGNRGITSIIRKAYNDPEILKSFACRARVKLMHPFNPNEFVRRFMAQVYAADTRNKQGADLGVQVLMKMKAKQEYLLKEFVEEVNKKTYLVILENLTDMDDWDAVRMFLPDMKNGSWIIVSTDQFEIASMCIGHSYQALELEHFTPDHSVCAFFKKGSRYYGDIEEKPMACEVSPNLSLGRIPSTNKQEIDEWITNYPLVGREPQMNDLRRCTAYACLNNSPVISVWGIAGIGKSALVRNLYYDRMLNSKQFSKYCWVDVSHPFSLRDFSRSLISNHHSEKDSIRECRELLKQHQCLVVIDGLQSKEEWDLIRAPLVFRDSRSIFIVITAEASIATYCTDNEDQVFNVKSLEADAAKDLFREEVRKKNQSSDLNVLNCEELDELILQCGGLPKVIVSLAAVLATQTVTLMNNISALNYKFMHNIENNPDFDSLRGLFDWMYNYFRTCPDSLKPCIFYLSIFPRGHNIRQSRVVRRWIAEGYSKDSEEESAVEKGENFFSKLLDLSIIQQIPQLGTRMVTCQVNGFIHEYIVSRRMEENLVFELGPYCALTTQRTGRHLIILKSWDRDEIIVFESIDFSRLRSLTVLGQWKSFFISKSMRLLRVLDLEDTSGVKDEDLKMMVQRMLRLKFLSLRGCSEICNLPSSLGDLRQLQTLDVRHTSIVRLPASIGKILKLQYIRAGTKVPASTPPASSSRLPGFRRGPDLVGVEVPRGIGKLTALHTLGVVNVRTSGGKAIVEELKKLTQLRKLGVSGINKHNSKDFLNATSYLVYLKSLFIQLDGDSQSCLDDKFLHSWNLQSLTLYGLQDKLPLSRKPLSKLRKLYLGMDTLQKNDMEFLGNLPELCILRLRVKQLQPEDGKLHLHAERNGEELDSFEKVKILEVTCRSSRLHVIFGSRSMKNLELLTIDCSSAVYQLTGMNGLCELKEVLLKGTDDVEIMRHLENQLVNHPRNPAVKLAGLARSS